MGAYKNLHTQTGTSNHSVVGNWITHSASLPSPPHWYRGCICCWKSTLTIRIHITLDQGHHGNRKFTMSSLFEGEGGYLYVVSTATAFSKVFSVSANLSYIGTIKQTEAETGEVSVWKRVLTSMLFMSDFGVQPKLHLLNRDIKSRACMQILTRSARITTYPVTVLVGRQNPDWWKPTLCVPMPPQFIGAGLSYNSLAGCWQPDHNYSWSHMKSSKSNVHFEKPTPVIGRGMAYTAGNIYRNPGEILPEAGRQQFIYGLIQKESNQLLLHQCRLNFTLITKCLSLGMKIRWSNSISTQRYYPAEQAGTLLPLPSQNGHTRRK